MSETAQRLLRLRRAIAAEPLPCAFVDLDAFDANIERLRAPIVTAGKTLRPATKSIRVPALMSRVLSRPGVRGLMTYSPRETLWLAEQGFSDLLCAYPSVQQSDVDALAAASARTAVHAMCDAVEHLDTLNAAAERRGVTVGVMVEIDMSYRPVERVHLGVRRSPLRTAADALAFAERVARYRHLRFDGVMGYEAHVAGVGDRGSFTKRAMKLAARRVLERTRADIARALDGRLSIFNGGGTGSVMWAAGETALTEITAGSGFLDSHLFDHYVDVPLLPAAFFALQVVRRPAPGIVTCMGGGYIASGAAGVSRLPIPVFPEGSSLIPLEGAGEVQTPVQLARGVDVALGDAVLFRHAKAGELAEHFAEYLLIRNETIEARVPTYRGIGNCFVG
jgi:D-serine deaminase-like pyridoxal phosphate-dependent protein